MCYNPNLLQVTHWLCVTTSQNKPNITFNQSILDRLRVSRTENSFNVGGNSLWVCPAGLWLLWHWARPPSCWGSLTGGCSVCAARPQTLSSWMCSILCPPAKKINKNTPTLSTSGGFILSVVVLMCGLLKNPIRGKCWPRQSSCVSLLSCRCRFISTSVLQVKCKLALVVMTAVHAAVSTGENRSWGSLLLLYTYKHAPTNHQKISLK